MFKYHTGEEVEVGDRIYYPSPFCYGTVSLILEPQSIEACEWGLPRGAILLSFGSNENSMAIDKPEQDEDLVFVERNRS